jgi:membrane-associated phospholipid phosphatase
VLRRALSRLVAGFAALTVFTWLTAALVRAFEGAWITASLDAPVVEYIAAHRSNCLSSLMKAVTAAGDDPGLWIAVLVGGAILAWRKQSWRPQLLLALVMIGAVSLDHLVKLLVARTRPPLLLQLVASTGWSFPSGHATESAAVYFALAHMFAGTQIRPEIKTLLCAIAFVAVCLIGVSRVYLGVHWPTDVICGWALGGAWSAIVLGAGVTIQDSR